MIPPRAGVTPLRTRYLFMVALLAVMLSVAAAQAEDAISKEIIIRASGRMANAASALAVAYAEKHPGVVVKVEPGQDAGEIGCVTRGMCDIAAVPHAPTIQEYQVMRARSGKDLYVYPIAKDAVVICVNPINQVRSLTERQLGDIFRGEINWWREVGLPGEQIIRRLAPARGEGTPLFFETRVMNGAPLSVGVDRFPTLEETRRATEEKQTSISLLSVGSSIGLKIPGIKWSDPNHASYPQPEKIRDGSYPLSHYVYWCTAGQPTGAVRDLIRFANSAEGQNIIERSNAGLVGMPAR